MPATISTSPNADSSTTSSEVCATIRPSDSPKRIAPTSAAVAAAAATASEPMLASTPPPTSSVATSGMKTAIARSSATRTETIAGVSRFRIQPRSPSAL